MTLVFYWQPTYSGDELVFSTKIKPLKHTNHLESNPQIKAKQVAYIISCFLRLCHVIFCADLKTTFCSIINTTFSVYIIVNLNIAFNFKCDFKTQTFDPSPPFVDAVNSSLFVSTANNFYNQY